MDKPKIHLAGFDIEWDLENGLNLWAGSPTLSMWISTTVAGLMKGLHAMVGTERFNLCLQQGGIESVEGDWQVISSQPTFEQGLEAMRPIASSAGWGRWEIVSIDRAQKVAVMRTINSWEGIYQRALGVRWGSAMMAGKYAGLCGRLFETPCWAEQTVFSADGGEIDEFVIKPTSLSADERLSRLVNEGQASQADLQAALKQLQQEVQDRQHAEEELRTTLELVQRQQDALRAMETPIIQVWDGVLAIPLMGILDSSRAAAVTERLLQHVADSRSQHAILDLTGIETIDTSTADHLLRIMRAVELLGARALITGIRPAVAQTMASLGVDLSRVATLRNLQEGIKNCMKAAS